MPGQPGYPVLARRSDVPARIGDASRLMANGTQITELKAALRDRTIAVLHGELDKLHGSDS